MELSHSWKAKRYSTKQEIPCISFNLKVHYRIHKRPPPTPTLRQINSLRASPSYFPRSILILCSYLRRGLLSSLFPSGLPTKPLNLQRPEQCAVYIYIYIYIHTHTHTHIYIYIYTWQPAACVYTAAGKIINCAVPVNGILLRPTAVLNCGFYFNDEIMKQASSRLWDAAWTHWLLYSMYVYIATRRAWPSITLAQYEPCLNNLDINQGYPQIGDFQGRLSQTLLFGWAFIL